MKAIEKVKDIVHKVFMKKIPCYKYHIITSRGGDIF